MALNLNVTTNNTATTHGVRGNDISPTMQTYYDKKMLEEMKPKLLHLQFGQKRPIPRHGGKTIQFRKWTPFDAKTDALVEGEPGDGQKMVMTQLTAAVEQYGGYVAISDLLDLTALDPVVNDAVQQMADQGALSLDTIAREILTTSADATNVIYAAGSERSSIAATDVLTSTLLRKAVRALKKARAPMFNYGGKPYYIAIVGPDTTYDLQSDQMWQDVSKYQAKEKIFYGEIGTIFGVKIIETTESKIFSANPYILEEGTDIEATATLTTISTDAYLSATPSIQVVETATQLGAAGIAALKNKYVVIAGQRRKIVAAAAHTTPANGTILTLDAALTGFTNKAAALNSITLYPAGGGKTANDVAATLILGRDAYGTIDIASGGAVRTIIKPRGSAGTADPLDQISTVGWKANAFTVKILMPSWMVRIEHGFSA
jgi:N4-gp56 family major capsid protein